MGNIWLHRFSVLACAATLLLVVAGGLVTSNEAGLSVPDWPLSYGRLIPPLEGNIVYEFAHRATAAIVGLLTIALAVWVTLRDPRAWMRRLAWIAVAAVLLQAVLGGLTVKLLVPKSISIVHAMTAELYFMLTVAMACFLSPGWQGNAASVDDDSRPSLAATTAIATAVLLAQSVLGATVRHGVMTVVPHIIGAVVATAAIMWAGLRILIRHMDHAALRRSAMWALSFTFSQVFLGLGAYMSRIATADAPQPMPLAVGFTVAHVAAGALALGSSLAMTIEVFRRVRRPLTAVAQGGVAVA